MRKPHRNRQKESENKTANTGEGRRVYVWGRSWYSRHSMSCRSLSVARRARDTGTSSLLRAERMIITLLGESLVADEAGTCIGARPPAEKGRLKRVTVCGASFWDWLHSLLAPASRATSTRLVTSSSSWLKPARSKTRFFFRGAPSAPGFIAPKKFLVGKKCFFCIICFFFFNEKKQKKHVFFPEQDKTFFFKPNPVPVRC